MRLWHKDLISVLPRSQLLGQWRECCCIARNISLMGTPNHILVNRIMNFPLSHFCTYCKIIYEEMLARGYSCNWINFSKWMYGMTDEDLQVDFEDLFCYCGPGSIPWHDEQYYWQCCSNLEEKYDCGGIPIDEWDIVCDQVCEKL